MYPREIRRLATKQWTSLKVAEYATNFLTPTEGVKILDIGSGVGKFCLAGAHYAPKASFYGIEQRTDLVAHANAAKSILQLPNVRFLSGNFTRLDFKQYDHFYFFNSFYEHLAHENQIDNKIKYSITLFDYYTKCLYDKLDKQPVGARIVTYHLLENRMPPGYEEVESLESDLLKCWIKR